MAKLCPDCGRDMRPKTGRTPEGAWYCEYCQGAWTPVAATQNDSLVKETPGNFNKESLNKSSSTQDDRNKDG